MLRDELYDPQLLSGCKRIRGKGIWESILGPRNEKKVRILRRSGEKAIYFSAYKSKTDRFTFLKVALFVGQFILNVYNLFIYRNE